MQMNEVKRNQPQKERLESFFYACQCWYPIYIARRMEAQTKSFTVRSLD